MICLKCGSDGENFNGLCAYCIEQYLWELDQEAWMEQEKARLTLEAMTNPRKWPMSPFLPLIRRREGKEPELGFLYWDGPGKLLMPTVYYGEIYRAVNRKVGVAITTVSRAEVEQLTNHTYLTFGAIIHDGWEID